MASNDCESCTICLNRLREPGMALFVAECSHTFHFRCIESNAQSGNLTCPLCRVTWTTLPFSAPPAPPVHQSALQQVHAQLLARSFLRAPPEPASPREQPLRFNDDEPIVQAPSPAAAQNPSAAAEMTITMQAEHQAVSAEPDQKLTAIVSVRSPDPEAAADAQRTGGVDLIAVLDVSGSMEGEKISHLRQTLLAALDLLGPSDRLSIIKFNSEAQRLTPLTCMSDAGRAAAQSAILSLVAGGGTIISSGLELAVNVVTGRRQRNPVCGIILLTDGQDGGPSGPLLALAGRARAAGANVSCFGYGGDHDSRLLENVAEAGQGSFTYIDKPSAARETFARCLGSLFSVVAQAVRVTVRPSNSATLASVHSSAGVQAPLPDGSASVDLGDMFRSESRDFLVHLTLPRAAAAAPAGAASLDYLHAEVSWEVPGSADGGRRAVAADGLRVARLRGADVAAAWERERQDPAAAASHAAVERQRNRYLVVDALTNATKAGDAGRMADARTTLMEAMRQVESSSTAKEPMGQALMEDLKQAMEQMRTASDYQSCGHAVLRSKKMAHKSQRSYEHNSASSRLYSTPCQASACAAMSAPPAASSPPTPPPSGFIPPLSSLRIGVRAGGCARDMGPADEEETEETEELHEQAPRPASAGLLKGGLNLLKSLSGSFKGKGKGKASKP